MCSRLGVEKPDVVDVFYQFVAQGDKVLECCGQVIVTAGTLIMTLVTFGVTTIVIQNYVTCREVSDPA